MDSGRPLSWGIAVGLGISILGLICYFGVILYERVSAGYDWSNMSIEQWASNAAVWLFFLGLVLALVGVLWVFTGGVGGGTSESTGDFTPSELEIIKKQTERARMRRGQVSAEPPGE
jgi:hypothetical protein